MTDFAFNACTFFSGTFLHEATLHQYLLNQQAASYALLVRIFFDYLLCICLSLVLEKDYSSLGLVEISLLIIIQVKERYRYVHY